VHLFCVAALYPLLMCLLMTECLSVIADCAVVSVSLLLLLCHV